MTERSRLCIHVTHVANIWCFHNLVTSTSRLVRFVTGSVQCTVRYLKKIEQDGFGFDCTIQLLLHTGTAYCCVPEGRVSNNPPVLRAAIKCCFYMLSIYRKEFSLHIVFVVAPMKNQARSLKESLYLTYFWAP